jgi:hypothetical protein
MKTILIPLFFFLLQLFNTTNAQSNFVAAGSSATTMAGEVSVSIGQTAYVSDSSSSGSVFEGNQQTYDIIDGIIHIPADGYSVKAFPNPFPGNIYITITGDKLETVDVELWGPQGNLLKHETFTSAEHMLKTEHLSPGSYVILIRSKNFETRRYKLIKNK